MSSEVPSTEVPTVAEFDQMSADLADGLLLPCCASTRWVTQVVAARPYLSLPVLTAASAAVLDQLSWDDVLAALAAHPKIGQQATGTDRESTFSRAEQSSTATADEQVRKQLRAGNIAYEQRFGWVFLICATGLTPQQMLAALTARLPNTDEAEQEIVRVELGKIVALRLAKTLR